MTNTIEIELLRAGKFVHPAYGDLEVTETDLDEMIKEFDDAKAHGRRGIDFDHKAAKGDTRMGAWIQALRRKGTSMVADVELTAAGQAELEGGNYRFTSAEYNTQWKDKITGKVRKTKRLRGATFTNRPFIEDMTPVSLSDDPEAEVAVRSEPVFLHDQPNASKMTYVTSATANSGTTQNVVLATTSDGESKGMDEIRSVLQLSDTATDEDVLAAVRKLTDRKPADLSGFVALSEHEAVKAELAETRKLADATAETLRRAEWSKFFGEQVDAGRTSPAEHDSLVVLYDLNPEATKAAILARPKNESRTKSMGGSGQPLERVDVDGHRDEHRIGLDAAAQRLLAEGKAKDYGTALILAESELGA